MVPAKLKPTEKMNLPFGNAVLHSGESCRHSGNDDGQHLITPAGLRSCSAASAVTLVVLRP